MSRTHAPARLRRAAVLGALLGTAVAFPPAASAALVNFGSSLASPATVAIAHPVDTAFWATSLAGGGAATAPGSGQVLAVRIRGCAKRGSGGQAPLTQVHFQVLSPSGGKKTVKATSGPSNLPICGGSVSGSTVSTFHPVNLCVKRGQSVAFNDEGGGAAAFPGGVGYEVFASVPGSTTTSYTGANATNNGDKLAGRPRAGLELLMQLVLGTGSNAGPACRG